MVNMAIAPSSKKGPEMVAEMAANSDRAGKAYWDATWRSGALPEAVDPDSVDVWHYPQRQLHRFFMRCFPGGLKDARVVEIGCARSPWLPYVAKQFGAQVVGIDYSEIGAEQARQVLANEGVLGQVKCIDLFSIPDAMRGEFDVAMSFGVMEHFDNTAGALGAAAALLRPGGLLVTQIPNLAGVLGWIQKRLSRRVYDIHVPLDAAQLARAHEQAGLSVERCEYVSLTQFGVLNPGDLTERPFWGTIGSWSLFALRSLSAGIWWMDERLMLRRPGRWTGGYIVCAARKPT
jgi:SAM-dependent methyltransferase